MRPLLLVRRCAALFAALLVAAPAVATPSPVSRRSGPDRITTAVAVARSSWDNAGDVLLAGATSYSDALAASPLAARRDAPLLLTASASLPDAVRSELRRLGAERVHLLGGRQSIGDSVERALVDEGYEVTRLHGEERYTTAARIAAAAGPAASGEAVLVLGEHRDPGRAWPDALAAGTLAAVEDPSPLLLTRPDELPAVTEETLAQMGVRSVLLVGGTSGIGTSVEERLRSLGYGTRRVAGPSRYATSTALAAETLARLPAGPRAVVFASGERYADALSAAALAARATAPLVLVPHDDFPLELERFLRERSWSHGVLVGGEAAVSDHVHDHLVAAVRNAVEATFEGDATWYGPGFEGRRTACGEVFDSSQLTAAHRTLPCGTWVRATNRQNGRTVLVRINDRGPFGREDLVLDFSTAAADRLGMREESVVPVRAEVLED